MFNSGRREYTHTISLTIPSRGLQFQKLEEIKKRGGLSFPLILYTEEAVIGDKKMPKTYYKPRSS